MWILFSVLCMVTLTATEMIGKKTVGEDELAPIKLRIMCIAVSFVLGLLMHALHLGESGLAPWTLMAEHPIILVAVSCSALSAFLYIFSLKYVGMTIMEAVSSLENMVIFPGLIMINLITGSLGAVKDMFVPARLVFILLMIACTVLLPNIELLANRNAIINEEQKRERKRMVLGILISLAAVILSCGDSLIADTLLDSDAIGIVDMTMTAYFSAILLLPPFCFALLEKCRSKKAPCKIISRYSAVYAILHVAVVFMYILAASYDAVRSELMFLAYPVISILGAKTVLKERYTRRENICIWIITLSAIGFCVIDYLV